MQGWKASGPKLFCKQCIARDAIAARHAEPKFHTTAHEAGHSSAQPRGFNHPPISRTEARNQGEHTYRTVLQTTQKAIDKAIEERRDEEAAALKDLQRRFDALQEKMNARRAQGVGV